MLKPYVLILWLAALAAASPAASRSPPDAADRTIVLRGDDGFAAALAWALRAGDLPGALALLNSRPDLLETAEGLRLQAELLAALGRGDQALAVLERRLARQPQDALARFQVAEIHFAAGRRGAATLSYRRALAGDLDAVRRRLAHQRLVALGERGGLSGHLAVGVASDSNINAATDDRTVELFGLPFELSEDARRRSGVSSLANARLSYVVLLAPALSLQADLSAALSDAEETAFDQGRLALAIGPEWKRGEFTGRIDVVGAKSWLGGELVQSSRGLRASGEAYAKAAVWRAEVEVEQFDDRRSDRLDGNAYAVAVSRTAFLGPTRLWRLSGAWEQRNLEGVGEGHDEVQLAVGRLFALPFSCAAYVEPYLLEREFHARSPLLAERRRDREAGVTLRLSKRDWLFGGAAPFVQATVVRADSTAAFGRYGRERLEVGLTRTF